MALERFGVLLLNLIGHWQSSAVKFFRLFAGEFNKFFFYFSKTTGVSLAKKRKWKKRKCFIYVTIREKKRWKKEENSHYNFWPQFSFFLFPSPQNSLPPPFCVILLPLFPPSFLLGCILSVTIGINKVMRRWISYFYTKRSKVSHLKDKNFRKTGTYFKIFVNLSLFGIFKFRESLQCCQTYNVLLTI